nr:MAG TPA: hypothetical protein [Caudoviricetes sp.]
MRVNNKKVNEAINRLDSLSELNSGYYLSTYNARPDKSSKKYHLYVKVVNGYQAINDTLVESFNSQKEFINYVNNRCK